ncbi:hypothetical protein KIH86_12230 [Paenibacillus sp. HN-1]|uniref:hypothetical protein n=1 Tax=Paenibacillus TaxID=44249 RepID=UPI001CA99617|nr:MULTISPECIES: hypothetical protein [Paenibacillus]MBY9081471.1 hypothetical protein [Paenibacillus sp. CGMCC 1.18879]MBY9084991.1 hypothetical protein [Paenibacillus sinensis]
MEITPEVKDNVKLSEKLAKAPGRFLFRLGLADVLRFTMFGTMVSVVNDVTRLPLQLPGHTSVWWMGLLILGKGLIPKFGGGIIMGAVSGVLAVLLGLGKEGIFIFFKYLAPGLLLDIMSPLFFHRLGNPFVGVICGALTSLSKLLVSLLLGVLLDLPMGFLALGLGYSSLTHIVFGAIGGLIASMLIHRLKPRLTAWEQPYD